MLMVQTKYGILEGVQERGTPSSWGSRMRSRRSARCAGNGLSRPGTGMVSAKRTTFPHRAWQTVQEPPP